MGPRSWNLSSPYLWTTTLGCDSLHLGFALREFGWGRRAAAALQPAVAPSPEDTSQEVRLPGWPALRLLRCSAGAPVRATSHNDALKCLQKCLWYNY